MTFCSFPLLVPRFFSARHRTNLICTPGFGKKFSYVIAFSIEGATDVTRRYARKAEHALARHACSESVLLHITNEIRNLRRANMSTEDQLRLKREDSREQQEMSTYIVSGITADLLSAGLASAEISLHDLCGGPELPKQSQKLVVDDEEEGNLCRPN
jgi:peptide-N4-(N-acetyl-beta-glucosaminyl)asparagine amidase